MKHLVIIFSFLLIVTKIGAQMGVSFGTTVIKPFGFQQSNYGFHALIELSNDDSQTFYGRLTFTIPRNTLAEDSLFVQAKDPNTVPYLMLLPTQVKYNYTMLDFGKRFYFGEGYDSGFGLYGGSNMSLVFNRFQNQIGNYDRTKYMESSGFNEEKHSIIGLSFGLNGGIKQTLRIGTIYFDAGINYAIFAMQSDPSVITPDNYRSLFFNLNFGFRKELY